MSTTVRWPALESLAETARRGDRSAAVRSSLERIRELGGELGALLHVRQIEQDPLPEPSDGEPGTGELLGVPIAVTDNIAVRGLPMTCGSRVLEGFVPPFDATVIRRLRDAGAVVVGKTNMDEFAMGSSTETSAFGVCRNPWDLERVPGGSSGGSAAAVAAGLVPVALGSDTGGSVRQPAAFCGVVGFKPSYGALSRFGLVAYGSSLDQIGVLATRVSDAERLFSVMHGPDDRDGTLAPAASFQGPQWATWPPVVGVLKEHLGNPALDPATAAALERALEAFRAGGMEVRELSVPSIDEVAVPAYYLTACAEASSNLARFDGVRYGARDTGAPENMEQMVRASRARFGREVQLRILLGTFVLRAGHYEHYYGRAWEARQQVVRALAGVFEEVDILATPTAPTQAFRIGELVDDPVRMKLTDEFTVTANLAGLPAISLPVDVANGLPTAVQLMTRRFRDLFLLRVASRLEKRLHFDPSGCPVAGRGPAVGVSP